MKKIVSLIIAFASISCTNAQKKEFSPEALSENLTAFDGSQVAFKEIIEKHKGKTVVIEVWASWCSDCIKAMPQVKELQMSNPETDFVFLSVDKKEDKWKTGIENHQVKGDNYWISDPNGMKGAFGKAIDLDWIPRYIVLDKTGKIILYRAIEKDFEKINTVLQKEKGR